jgi:rod shape determining protein RodA
MVGIDIYAYCQYLDEHELNALQDTGLYEKHSWMPLKDYQRNRILAFIFPEAIDPQGIGIGWNLKQSLIAVGSGGFSGKGKGEGVQSLLGYLPQSVAPNDFIFSVFAEESGFLGSIWVIGLFIVLIFNSLRIAQLARDRFGLLLSLGIAVIFMVHVFINMAMTIGLMPITGLPLPFISHGGSFVLTCCFLQGLVQSVFRFKKIYH